MEEGGDSLEDEGVLRREAGGPGSNEIYLLARVSLNLRRWLGSYGVKGQKNTS